MRKFKFLILSVLACGFVMAQNPANSVPAKKIITKTEAITQIGEQKTSIVTGNIKGFKNDAVYFRYFDVANTNNFEIDTIIAKGGSFTFNLKHSETIVCMIYTDNCFVTRQNGRPFLPDSKLIRVFLTPGSKVSVSGELKNNELSYIAKGNEVNLTYSTRRNANLSETVAMISNMLMLDSMQTVGAEDKKINAVGEFYSIQQTNALYLEKLYVKENPDKDLSAIYISNQPMDTIPGLMKLLKENVKTGMFSKMLTSLNTKYENAKRIAEAEKKVTEGTQAPEFKLKSIEGNDVNLSDFKDKYIVLDFWGSWCYWCIKGIPDMKAYYDKYKAKLEFIGIACRDKDQAWREAVKKYELNWVQLFNNTGTDVPVLYGVNGYPTKFVLDKNHKVILKVVGEDPVFYKKLDEIMQKAE